MLTHSPCFAAVVLHVQMHMHSKCFFANCSGDVASISITAGTLKSDKDDQILDCKLALQAAAAAEGVHEPAPESQFLPCWHPLGPACRTSRASGWQPA